MLPQVGLAWRWLSSLDKPRAPTCSVVPPSVILVVMGSGLGYCPLRPWGRPHHPGTWVSRGEVGKQWTRGLWSLSLPNLARDLSLVLRALGQVLLMPPAGPDPAGTEGKRPWAQHGVTAAGPHEQMQHLAP